MFSCFQKEQDTDNNEDVNSSNNSLRRKLFFNFECNENDNESIASISSVEMSGSMILSNSPPQSGMFIRGSFKVCEKNLYDERMYKTMSYFRDR